jgi:molybdopterin-guanine dinucleotide biosynthesis protein A
VPIPPDTRPATVVAILAGGRSRRMGVPKAGVLLDGRPLLHHAVAAARDAGLRPVVVAKRDSVLPGLDGLERWDEPDEPVHPLAGAAAALRRARAPIVVLPVDLPGVPGELLAHLATRTAPLVVVEGAGRLHPLLARVVPGCADDLAAAAAAGDPVVATVRALGAQVVGDDVLRAWGDPATLLRNVNRPEDVAGPDPDDDRAR